MNPSLRSSRGLLAAAVLLGALVAGCKKHAAMDIPLYPGSAQARGYANQESDTGTLFHLYRSTPDRGRQVAAFYQKELVEQRGWSEVPVAVGQAFSDGNLDVKMAGIGSGGSTTEVVDPSLSGGYVLVYEFQNATYIEIWQHVPNPQ